MSYKVPIAILGRRLHQYNGTMTPQVLVRWFVGPIRPLRWTPGKMKLRFANSSLVHQLWDKLVFKIGEMSPSQDHLPLLRHLKNLKVAQE